MCFLTGRVSGSSVALMSLQGSRLLSDNLSLHRFWFLENELVTVQNLLLVRGEEKPAAGQMSCRKPSSCVAAVRLIRPVERIFPVRFFKNPRSNIKKKTDTDF